MTWHEQAWVEINSPYEGGAYATHLIIAGIVNPDNGYDLWVAIGKLAIRCHCSVRTLHRHIERMVEDGLLVMMERGGGRGNATHYRFLMPAEKQCQNGTVSEESQDVNCVISDINCVKPRAQTVTNQESLLLLTKEEQKGTKIVRNITSDISSNNFPSFWNLYPRRNGKRLYKPQAEAQWKKLKPADQAAAVIGAGFYAKAAVDGLIIAKDCYRWVRDHSWDDWQEPAIEDIRRKPQDPLKRGEESLASQLARLRQTEQSRKALGP
jgi:hypothetical protein